MTELGVAEAKRRFSELLDRVGKGEHIVIHRHGKAAVAMVPPAAAAGMTAPTPAGFASIAGALADLDDVDEMVGEIYAARSHAADRPIPDLD